MKRVALVGTAPSGATAPFGDESWDIWGVGLRSSGVKRATRWFELHRLDGEEPAWAAEWRRLMKTWDKETPIWMIYPEPDLGNVVPFNPNELMAKYGTFFMTSSFSWMMAQAIEEGYEEIGLWGVDMEYGTEYRQQRVGLRHFIEIAKLKGIRVTRVVTSGIAYEPVAYPFWQDDPVLAKNGLRRKTHDENRRNCQRQFDETSERILRFQGGRIELKKLITDLKNADDEQGAQLEKRLDAIDNEIESLREVRETIRDDLRRNEGAIAECAWLEDYLQP